MIKHLYNEFIKNIKIMFRNWTSLSLLVIAPLVLILLIGYAFSSEDVTGVIIGVISKDEIDLTPLAYNVSNYAVLQEFATVEDCLSEMILQKVHICISLEGVFPVKQENITEIADFPSGKVVYYYDNTRKKVSLTLIQGMQDFFGLRAEQISIESAESVIENIQDLILFINERKEDINKIKNESVAIKSDLVERKKKLEQVRDAFLPPYLVVKDAQARLHNYTLMLNSSASNLGEAVNGVSSGVDKIQGTIAITAPWLLNETTGNTTGNDTLGELFENLDTELSELLKIVNATTLDINLVVSHIDDTVGELDKIKNILDEEIARNEEYIRRIDESIAKIDKASKELEFKLSQLSRLQPDVAKKLVKPISYEYEKILENVRNIQLAFPLLLVLIIMFIALLFANISTLMEIHNRAYIRNLIAPVDDLLYIVGMLLTGIIVVFLQILVLFSVAQFKLGVMILQIFWQISLISILLITTFVLLGMIFAYLFKTVQSSILVTTFSSLIFFLFSNALLPTEAMPGFARFLSSHNPIVIGEYLGREVQLFRAPLAYFTPQILLLVIYICVLFLIVVALAKNKNRRRG